MNIVNGFNLRYALIRLLAGRDLVLLNAQVGGDVGVKNRPGQGFFVRGNAVAAIPGLPLAVRLTRA